MPILVQTGEAAPDILYTGAGRLATESSEQPPIHRRHSLEGIRVGCKAVEIPVGLVRGEGLMAQNSTIQQPTRLLPLQKKLEWVIDLKDAVHLGVRRGRKQQES